ncbi:hypothetical protein EYF80_042898 [Liparis tanakae]|uniref:Uncharacterized protein n=1 Tax=Liparis tanakae TaxID=230148 RepID=A0A4Z2G085_9TELE|nr:hypothetical protein EYF80_042898 [Liparis tanakae]
MGVERGRGEEREMEEANSKFPEEDSRKQARDPAGRGHCGVPGAPYLPATVSASSRLWVLRLQWPASLYTTSVLSSRWLSSFSFLLALDWFVILPVETGGRGGSWTGFL